MPNTEQTDKERSSALVEHEAGENLCNLSNIQQRYPEEHPRTRGSSVESLFGSCSSGKRSDEDNNSTAASLERPKQQHPQDPSSSQALGHAVDRYLKQALQEEPWNLAVKREQNGKVFSKQQTDGLAGEAEARSNRNAS